MLKSNNSIHKLISISELKIKEKRVKKMSDRELLEDIEEHREMMIYWANTTSFSNPKVIDISTKLDHLLNKYDEIVNQITIK